jgi:hypothetical protein
MNEYANPSLATHIAQTAELPAEDMGQLTGRPDLPVPSLWQGKVKVKHKVTGEPAVVARLDFGLMMFRAFYTAREGRDGTMGRWSERTEWEHCRDWDVEVTFSPAELERQAAKKLLEDQIAKLDAGQIALARVLCDDPDPNKALAKLRMLIQAGLVKMPEEVAQAMVEPELPPEPKPTRRKAAEPKGEP